MIHNLSLQKSILTQFIAELRDVEIQKDRMRFRRNLERIGELFAYEISKTLSYETKETITPLGIAESQLLFEHPVIVTILRAGLPLHNGMLNVFDRSENGFISAYRRHHKNNTFEIALEYIAAPDVQGKTVVLCDPMLASGSSLVLCYKSLLTKGTPKHTHIVSTIASKQGLDYVRSHMPTNNFTIWCRAVDEELTAQAYIVPGLGDAGDLAFGDKL